MTHETQLDAPTDDILGRRPGGILRWGTASLIAIVGTTFVGASLVPLPEVVRGSAVVTVAESAVRVTLPTGGTLATLLVKDDEEVQAGTPLALLSTTADLDAVSEIEAWAKNALPRLRVSCEPPPQGPPPDRLGLLTQAYVAAQERQRNVAALAATEVLQGRRAQVFQQQDLTARRIDSSLARTRDLLADAEDLAVRARNRQSSLEEVGGVSREAVEDAQAVVVRQRIEEEAARRTQIENGSRTLDREDARYGLDLDRLRTRRLACAELSESLASLVVEIERWRERYVLDSPAAGTVEMIRPLSSNEFIAAGSEILAVRRGAGGARAEVRLPQQNAGLVRIGQRVLIRLESFPAGTYGVLEGSVADIADVPFEDEYRLSVHLSHGATTTYGKRLDLREGLTGTAEVVTEEVTLLVRLIGSLRQGH